MISWNTQISRENIGEEKDKKLTPPSISLAFLSNAAADLIACSTATQSDVRRPFPYKCKLRLGWKNNEHPHSSVVFFSSTARMDSK